MKLRYLKTISTEFVPVESGNNRGVWGPGMAVGQALGWESTLYTKGENVKTVLQFYDEEFSSWVDVPTVVERKGEK